MAIVRVTLDPNNPPKLSAASRARLEAMSPEEIERNALEDPDNPPMTDEEADRLLLGLHVRDIRKARTMTQEQFAAHFHINLGRLRDIEQGRTMPDSAFIAYLTVIEREPEAVDRALGAG